MVVSTPDGARAFVANIGSGSVTVVEGRKAIRQIPTGKGAEGIAITPDGREVWVVNREAGHGLRDRRAEPRGRRRRSPPRRFRSASRSPPTASAPSSRARARETSRSSTRRPAGRSAHLDRPEAVPAPSAHLLDAVRQEPEVPSAFSSRRTAKGLGRRRPTPTSSSALDLDEARRRRPAHRGSRSRTALAGAFR